MREAGQICYGTVTPPEPDCTGVPVLISDEVMEKRCAAVMARMEEENLDSWWFTGIWNMGRILPILLDSFQDLRRRCWF